MNWRIGPIGCGTAGRYLAHIIAFGARNRISCLTAEAYARHCHVEEWQTRQCRPIRLAQAAAVTSRHVCVADARKARCVLAEVRWRWTLKVL